MYNFYQEKDTNIPIIKNFNENKNLFLDQKIIDKLNELYIKHSHNKKIIVNKSKNITSYNINITPVDNEEILNKYYYFNKSKNQYFKKTRYYSYLDCYKIANFKKDNIKYCKEHSNNSININDKSTVIKCNYNNCKKNIKSDKKYCQNHKLKCLDDECDIRIMKNNSYPYSEFNIILTKKVIAFLFSNEYCFFISYKFSTYFLKTSSCLN